ncbi:MAG: IgGFc-binding protein [Myxococcales bacterium]
MMLPFSTWGKSYAGVKSVPYKQKNGSPVISPFPDYWRVVAGCGKTSCPNGTKVTIKPPPGQLILPDYPTPITCQGSICTLPPIDPNSPVPTAAWLEFTHASNFTITADQPVMLSQFFTGEAANVGSVEGDPSIILTPPVEQWRTSYNVLTSPTLVHNYLSLVTQSATPGIRIDGKDVSTFGPTQEFITGGFAVFKVPVAGGAHSITSKAKVGVTIYGYDSYVSYGYTGGLDLLRITQIVPGQ